MPPLLFRYLLLPLSPPPHTRCKPIYQTILGIMTQIKTIFSLFFYRADELTRRKMMQNSGKYPSSPRKISPPQFNMKQNSVEEPDPGQLLNEWLGELDNLQKVISDQKKHLILVFAQVRVEKQVTQVQIILDYKCTLLNSWLLIYKCWYLTIWFL